MGVARGVVRLGDPRGSTEQAWRAAMGFGPALVNVMPSGKRVVVWRSGRLLRQTVVVLFDREGLFLEIWGRHQA